MGTVLRHGNDAKAKYLPGSPAAGAAAGVQRHQPTMAFDTSSLKTVAKRDGDPPSSAARRSGPAAPNIPT
jgi:hypothetical protein